MTIKAYCASAAGLVLAGTVVTGASLQPPPAQGPAQAVPARYELTAPARAGTRVDLDAVRAKLQQPGGQDEFVPASQLPATEQLPAAPMLIAAYAFVWAALLFYVWSIWRRVQHVERDLDELNRRLAAREE